MDLNSILNQVLDVAKNSASKLETGNQTIDSLTKVGGGAALGKRTKTIKNPNKTPNQTFQKIRLMY